MHSAISIFLKGHHSPLDSTKPRPTAPQSDLQMSQLRAAWHMPYTPKYAQAETAAWPRNIRVARQHQRAATGMEMGWVGCVRVVTLATAPWGPAPQGMAAV